MSANTVKLLQVSLPGALRSMLGGNDTTGSGLLDLLCSCHEPVFATEEEVTKADHVLSTLSEILTPPLLHRRLTATWAFPVSPLIALERDGEPVGTVDYAEYSASAHWAATWADTPAQSLPLEPLSTLVPEDVDRDPALRAFALQLALEVAVEHLKP
jgi:hypothetical protein